MRSTKSCSILTHSGLCCIPMASWLGQLRVELIGTRLGCSPSETCYSLSILNLWQRQSSKTNADCSSTYSSYRLCSREHSMIACESQLSSEIYLPGPNRLGRWNQ